MDEKYDIDKSNIERWFSEANESTPSEAERNRAEEALIAFGWAHAQNPPDHLRDKILDKTGRLNRLKKQRQSFDIHHLPALDENANWMDWENAVRDIKAPEDFENIYLHPLESNENRDLFLIWVKEFVEEEVHHHFLKVF